MFAKLLAFISATFLLIAGSAGVASAKSESWSGVHKAAKVHHVKPASESWSGQHWAAAKPDSEVWSR